uniref:Uncharacterized protein n=1 Tax=Oryza brachyantha TaxID=4533 RepID=J3LJC1_ORYBR
MGVAADVGVLDEVARGRACRMRAVPRIVHWWRRRVYGGAAEGARADDLVVASAPGDCLKLAGALPLLGRRRHPGVAEGRVARQDPSVQEPNHHTAAEPGAAPEPITAEVKPKEPRRMGGRQRQELLRVQPNAPLLLPHRLSLVVGEPRGEPGQHVAVRVYDPRTITPRRLRQERAVPQLDRVAGVAVLPRLEMNHVVLPLLRAGDGSEQG